MVPLILEKTVRTTPELMRSTVFSSNTLDWNNLFLRMLEQIQSSVPFELYKPQPIGYACGITPESSVPFELYKPQRMWYRPSRSV